MSNTCSKNLSLTIEAFLYAYWAFEENATPWLDSVGDYDISIASASFISDPSGKIGKALQLINPTVTYSGPFTSQLKHDSTSQGFTVAGWLKYSHNGGSISVPFKFEHKIGATITYTLRMIAPIRAGTTLQLQCQLFDNAAHSISTIAFRTVPLTDFVFFAVWFDPSTKKLSLQLNQDTPQDSSAWAIANMLATDTVGLSITTDNAAAFDVWLDEIGYWKKVLSSSERASLYNSGIGVTYPNVPG